MPQANGMLVGLEAIARMFGKSRWSIACWIRNDGFPAARLPDGKWFTTMGLIEAWVLERRKSDPLISPEAHRGGKER